MKSKFSKMLVVFFVLLAPMILGGCYLNADVQQNEVAVQLFKNEIQAIGGAGVYSDMRFFSDLKTVNVGTQTFSVNDPEVLTSDNQAVNLTVTIQARRLSDHDSIINLLQNWSSMTDDATMVSVVTSTAREGMKNGVRGFTLEQLLDDRNGLANAIRDQLEQDASKYSVQIVNVTIENIGVDPSYMAVLNEKAILRAQTERELERQQLINQTAENDILQAQQSTSVLEEQLLQQQAQTNIDVEIARREGLKITEAYLPYIENPELLNLKQLELMQGILGEGTVYFIPENTNLNAFFNALTGTSYIPIPSE